MELSFSRFSFGSCCAVMTWGQQGDRVAPRGPRGKGHWEGWQVVRSWVWGWCHPYGMQVAAVGDSHPDAQHEGAGAATVGAAQELGFQHVTTAPIAQEAPGVQVHLVA